MNGMNAPPPPGLGPHSGPWTRRFPYRLGLSSPTLVPRAANPAAQASPPAMAPATTAGINQAAQKAAGAGVAGNVGGIPPAPGGPTSMPVPPPPGMPADPTMGPPPGAPPDPTAGGPPPDPSAGAAPPPADPSGGGGGDPAQGGDPGQAGAPPAPAGPPPDPSAPGDPTAGGLLPAPNPPLLDPQPFPVPANPVMTPPRAWTPQDGQMQQTFQGLFAPQPPLPGAEGMQDELLGAGGTGGEKLASSWLESVPGGDEVVEGAAERIRDMAARWQPPWMRRRKSDEKEAYDAGTGSILRRYTESIRSGPGATAPPPPNATLPGAGRTFPGAMQGTGEPAEAVGTGPALGVDKSAFVRGFVEGCLAAGLSSAQVKAAAAVASREFGGDVAAGLEPLTKAAAPFNWQALKQPALAAWKGLRGSVDDAAGGLKRTFQTGAMSRAERMATRPGTVRPPTGGPQQAHFPFLDEAARPPAGPPTQSHFSFYEPPPGGAAAGRTWSPHFGWGRSLAGGVMGGMGGEDMGMPEEGTVTLPFGVRMNLPGFAAGFAASNPQLARMARNHALAYTPLNTVRGGIAGNFAGGGADWLARQFGYDTEGAGARAGRYFGAAAGLGGGLARAGTRAGLANPNMPYEGAARSLRYGLNRAARTFDQFGQGLNEPLMTGVSAPLQYGWSKFTGTPLGPLLPRALSGAHRLGRGIGWAGAGFGTLGTAGMMAGNMVSNKVNESLAEAATEGLPLLRGEAESAMDQYLKSRGLMNAQGQVGMPGVPGWLAHLGQTVGGWGQALGSLLHGGGAGTAPALGAVAEGAPGQPSLPRPRPSLPGLPALEGQGGDPYRALAQLGIDPQAVFRKSQEAYPFLGQLPALPERNEWLVQHPQG